MRAILKKYKAEVIGVGLGAIAGWCYWYFVGCSSGTCAIASSPVNSTLYGALMGGVLGSMFKRTELKEHKKQVK
jgi:hypothetical protein